MKLGKNQKIALLSVTALGLFGGIGLASAKELTPSELPENAWIVGKYVFDESYNPSLKELIYAAQSSGLATSMDDIKIISKIGDDWREILSNKVIENIPDSIDVKYVYEVDEATGEVVKEEYEATDPVLPTRFGLIQRTTKKAGDGPKESSTYETHQLNQKAISTKIDGNTIDVYEDTPMKSYQSPGGKEEWYGLLLDFGIPYEDLELVSGYSDLDAKEAAKTYGSTNDTQVLLWLKGGNSDSIRTITFRNRKSGDAAAVTIRFHAKQSLHYTSAGEVMVPENQGVSYLNGSFTIDGTVSSFVFTDADIKKTAIYENNEWVIATDLNLKDVKKSLTNDEVKQSMGNLYENHLFNQNAYTVTIENGIITIHTKQALKSYTGPGGNAQWYGIILDLTTPLTEYEATSGYEITASDRTDGVVHGAIDKGQVLLWLKGNQTERTIVFTNKKNAKDKLTVKIQVVKDYPSLTLETVSKTDHETEAVKKQMGDLYDKYHHNMNSITVTKNGTEIEVTENNAMKSYNNGYLETEWYGVLVDLGIASEDLYVKGGYTIEEIDRRDGGIFGATGNQVLLWLQGGDQDHVRYITFGNKKDPNDTITMKIIYRAKVGVAYQAVGTIVLPENSKATYENGMFSVESNTTSFAFTDNGIAKTAIKDGATWKIATDLVLNDVTKSFTTDEVKEAMADLFTDHAYNQDSYQIKKEQNTIIITEMRALKSYAGPGGTAKWYGLLFDLTTPLSEFDATSGYEITEIDRTDGIIHGAITEGQVLLWLKGDQKERTIVFTNRNNPNDTITIKIIFEAIRTASYTENGDVVVKTDGVTFENHVFTIDKEITTFQFTDGGISKTASYVDGTWKFATDFSFQDVSIPTTGFDNPSFLNNQGVITVNQQDHIITVTAENSLQNYTRETEGKWYALVFDMTTPFSEIKVSENIEIESSINFGSSSNTSFVVWLQGNEYGATTITFTNVLNEDDTITYTVVFVP